MANELQVRAGQRGLQLNSLDEMARFADGVVKAGLAPATLNTSAKVVVALQVGAEIGLTPMAALRSVYVIKGTPTLYGDAALALVKSSSVCKCISEKVIGEGDAMEAVVESQRTDGSVVTTTFSVADAKQAGLWGKKCSTWCTHPKRMLKYKARACNLRDNFPDILLGLHLTEEMEGIEEQLPVPKCDTPTREDRRKPVDSVIVEDTEPDIIEPEDLGVEVEPTEDLHTQLLLGYLDKFPEGSFQSWAAFVLCVEVDEVDSKEKFTQGMLTHLIQEWNTKGFIDTEAGE